MMMIVFAVIGVISVCVLCALGIDAVVGLIYKINSSDRALDAILDHLDLELSSDRRRTIKRREDD